MKIQKIKLTFLIFAGLIISSFAVFAIAEENSTTSKNIFQDSDQDGLTNDEEATYGTDPNKVDTDGDSYSDGVEIKSGYDPLKPSPGDKIVNENGEQKESGSKVAGTSTEDSDQLNLTEQLSAKVASLISQSESENKDITIDDLDVMIDEATLEQITFNDLPEIDDSTINIKKQPYSSLSEDQRKAKEKEDALKYLTAVAYIMAANSPQKISSADDMQDFSAQIVGAVQNFSFESGNMSFFDNLIEKEKNVLAQLQGIEVPEKLLDTHKRGIQLATYINSLRDDIKIDPEDPVKSMAYLSKITSIISLSNIYFSDLESLLGEYGINQIPLSI